VQAQAHVQAATAAAAQAQSAAALAGYGKLFGPYPALASYRYAPYPIPAAVGAVNAVGSAVGGVGPAVAATATPTTAAAAATPTLAPPVPANPYQGYSLTNVDMSSFQGVDWGSMYGMGMYV